MNLQTLRQIGLNDSEIKVYFALLELESSSVGPIIEKARVPDSKIYAILQKLKEKGLATFVIKNKVKHFQASDPKRLVKIIDEKTNQLKAQKKELQEKIIPEIEKRRKLTQEKQEAIIYESKEGLKSAFLYLLDNLKRGEEYQVLMFEEGLGTKEMITFFREHHKRRVNKGIGVRLVSNIKHKEKIEKGHPPIKQYTRYTSQKFPVGIYIFKNHVMTALWEKRKAAFIIKSKENYRSYKKFFEELWEKTNC